jgi:hypothetical protein
VTIVLVGLLVLLSSQPSNPGFVNGLHCQNSMMTTGDILPNTDPAIPILKMYKIVDPKGRTVGWIYEGESGVRFAQANQFMSLSDASRAGFTMSGPRWSNVARFQKNPWSDLSIKLCQGSDWTHGPPQP